MKKILSAGLAACLAGCTANASSPDTTDAPFCRTTGPSEDRVNILVVGESWATNGRLMPELPDTFRQQTGKSVTACQIGYSGQHTRRQIESLKANFPAAKVRNLFDGKMIDYAVVLTGVNDVVLHRGANVYSNDVTELTAVLRENAKRVIVMEVPRVNLSPPASALSAMKRKAFYIVHDRNLADPVDAYNKALRQTHGAEVISYSPFFKGYPMEKARMQPDGIHLNDENLHRLGSYIGGEIATRDRRKNIQ